jgi:hypothetical protein
MMSFVQENFVWIAIIACLLVALISHKWRNFKNTRLRKKRFARGERMEAKAAILLKKRGFDILSSQEVFYHHYRSDGIDKKAQLQVDYVVSKKGKTYLVEVKSGALATQIENKSTRRQILEYSVAIDSDGVYLLDMEKESLQKVEFKPSNVQAKLSVYYKLLLLLMVCGAAASPSWDAKSVFIGLAIMCLSFPQSIHRLLAAVR